MTKLVLSAALLLACAGGVATVADFWLDRSAAFRAAEEVRQQEGWEEPCFGIHRLTKTGGWRVDYGTRDGLVPLHSVVVREIDGELKATYPLGDE